MQFFTILSIENFRVELVLSSSFIASMDNFPILIQPFNVSLGIYVLAKLTLSPADCP